MLYPHTLSHSFWYLWIADRVQAKPNKKFVADITYGILSSGSCLLADVVVQLHEIFDKFNIVDCLSKHLDKGSHSSAVSTYLREIKKWAPSEPIFHIDDTDVVKPNGYKFDSLGIVRDGFESITTKNVYEEGYHVTETYVFTRSNHPISILSKIYSS